MLAREGQTAASRKKVKRSDTMRLALIAVLVFAASAVFADADGPDFFRVTGVAEDDVLNMRAEPDPQAKKIGEIPPDGTCVRNLGCRGGLTFQEFTELSEKQKAQRLKENPRWCKVEYRGVEGWVAGHYLREGTCNSGAIEPAPDLSHLVGVLKASSSGVTVQTPDLLDGFRSSTHPTTPCFFRRMGRAQRNPSWCWRVGTATCAIALASVRHRLCDALDAVEIHRRISI
jgi:hypothetical protein